MIMTPSIVRSRCESRTTVSASRILTRSVGRSSDARHLPVKGFQQLSGLSFAFSGPGSCRDIRASRALIAWLAEREGADRRTGQPRITLTGKSKRAGICSAFLFSLSSFLLYRPDGWGTCAAMPTPVSWGVLSVLSFLLISFGWCCSHRPSPCLTKTIPPAFTCSFARTAFTRCRSGTATFKLTERTW